MKNNAYIYEYEVDGFEIDLMTIEEAIDLFGEKHVEQYGHYVPEELLNKYFELKKELEQVTDELRNIKDKTHWGQRD